MARQATKAEEVVDLASDKVEIVITPPKVKTVSVKVAQDVRFYFGDKWLNFKKGEVYNVSEELKNYLVGCKALDVL